jgi:hypothetical protein
LAVYTYFCRFCCLFLSVVGLMESFRKRRFDSRIDSRSCLKSRTWNHIDWCS